MPPVAGPELRTISWILLDSVDPKKIAEVASLIDTRDEIASTHLGEDRHWIPLVVPLKPAVQYQVEFCTGEANPIRYRLNADMTALRRDKVVRRATDLLSYRLSPESSLSIRRFIHILEDSSNQAAQTTPGLRLSLSDL
jgi:hypothetical protein